MILQKTVCQIYLTENCKNLYLTQNFPVRWITTESVQWTLLFQIYISQKHLQNVMLHVILWSNDLCIVETYISHLVLEYENHFDERRNVDEATSNEEFEFVNGPNL